MLSEQDLARFERQYDEYGPEWRDVRALVDEVRALRQRLMDAEERADYSFNEATGGVARDLIAELQASQAEVRRLRSRDTALEAALRTLVDATMDDGNSAAATAAHLHAQAVLAQ